MKTADLFSGTHDRFSIDIPDGTLCLFPHLFDNSEADDYFEWLLQNIAWKQDKISLYGKIHDIPRLSAWYGDEALSYQYSGIRATAFPWVSILLQIKQKIESVSSEHFNSVLLNQYRNGSDGVAWHSDDEPELGVDPVIASVSLGEERQFQLKHKKYKFLKKSFVLPHGSLLLMGGKIQAHWYHQVPKSKRQLMPRVNLTFRDIKK